MTLTNLSLNYKAKFQILDHIDPETVVDFVSIFPNDSVGFDLVEISTGEPTIQKSGEGDDFYDLDIQVELSFYHDGSKSLEELVENNLEFDLDGFFSVMDWELVGWDEVSLK
jgi:hypothetical protein